MKAPIRTVFYTLEATIKIYRRLAQQRIGKVVSGITVDQAMILWAVQEEPEISQKQVADLLFKDYASMARMVALMQKSGYLSKEQSAVDKRQWTMAVTPKGKGVLERLQPVIKQNRATALEGISKEEIQQLTNILGKIGRNCERMEEL